MDGSARLWVFVVVSLGSAVLAYRLERASEPNGSRAKRDFCVERAKLLLGCFVGKA